VGDLFGAGENLSFNLHGCFSLILRMSCPLRLLVVLLSFTLSYPLVLLLSDWVVVG
jgi:hypothetical protein